MRFKFWSGLSVPIEVKNADRVGAITFKVLYDPAVLEVRAVNKDKLALSAHAAFNKDTPGQLLVVIQHAEISGNGKLVTVKFRVLDKRGTSTFAIEVLELKSLKTRGMVESEITDGVFSASDMTVKAPVIGFKRIDVSKHAD